MKKNDATMLAMKALFLLYLIGCIFATYLRSHFLWLYAILGFITEFIADIQLLGIYRKTPVVYRQVHYDLVKTLWLISSTLVIISFFVQFIIW